MQAQLSVQEMFQPLTDTFHLVVNFLHPFFVPYAPFLSMLSLILILLFIAGIFWTVFVLRAVSSKEAAQYRPVDMEAEEAKEHKIQWAIVRKHLASENPAEWKIAILEADRILETLLISKGVQGDSLGEQLKSMTRRELVSINEAWEGHKMRNQIAHQGAAFSLTRREAEHTIALFEKVLYELDGL